jgi:hypothetical protein
MPAHRDERRRVIDHLQAFRIVRLADGDKRNVELSCGVDLTLGRIARTNLRRSPTAAPRQRGQGLKRGAGAAEMIDEGAKRPRPRYYGANATSRGSALCPG